MKNTLVILAMAGALRAAAPQYTVTPIATPAGWTDIVLSGLNDLGQMVGIGYNSSGPQGLVLTTASVTPIPQVPGLVPSGFSGINDHGLLVGYTYSGASFAGTVAGMSLLPATAAVPSRSNSSGQMASVCFNQNTLAPVPCIVTATGTTLIPLPAAFANIVYSGYPNGVCCTINDSGKVAGTAVLRFGGQWQAIVGTPAGSAAIPLPSSWPPASWYIGSGINNSGHVVAEGANAAGLGQAFIWSGSSSAAIPLLAGTLRGTTSVLAINDSDVVVGASDYVNWWIWDAANGTRLLNPLPSGWTFSAIAINNPGQILAQATSPQGIGEYVLLTPVAPLPTTPAPATLGLTVVGLALLALLLYRRSAAASAGGA